MKKKYFLNGNILDPHNSIEEMGGLIISEDGKIEAIGKKVNKNITNSHFTVIWLFFEEGGTISSTFCLIIFWESV